MRSRINKNVESKFANKFQGKMSVITKDGVMRSSDSAATALPPLSKITISRASSDFTQKKHSSQPKMKQIPNQKDKKVDQKYRRMKQRFKANRKKERETILKEQRSAQKIKIIRNRTQTDHCELVEVTEEENKQNKFTWEMDEDAINFFDKLDRFSNIKRNNKG